MKRRRIVVLFVALLLSLVVAAGAAVAAGLYATSVIASSGVTTPNNALSAPDGKLAVWDPEGGYTALDMGQQVCGPLYVYAPAPADGTSASGMVVAYRTPGDFEYWQAVGSNFLYAADYANGRYVVKQFFPLTGGGAPDPTQPPYPGSFQVVGIFNVSEDGLTPLTVDAVRASSCVAGQNDQGQNNNKQGQNQQ